jgi:hypothetical protein
MPLYSVAAWNFGGDFQEIFSGAVFVLLESCVIGMHSASRERNF